MCYSLSPSKWVISLTSHKLWDQIFSHLMISHFYQNWLESVCPLMCMPQLGLYWDQSIHPKQCVAHSQKHPKVVYITHNTCHITCSVIVLSAFSSDWNHVKDVQIWNWVACGTQTCQTQPLWEGYCCCYYVRDTYSIFLKGILKSQYWVSCPLMVYFLFQIWRTICDVPEASLQNH